MPRKHSLILGRVPDVDDKDLGGHRSCVELRSFVTARGHYEVAPWLQERSETLSHALVLSDGLWRRRFGGDPSIVGRTIPLEGGAYEVLGVMPGGFEYPVGAIRPTDVWVPYVVPSDEQVRKPHSMSIYLQTIARVKPGVRSSTIS